MLFLLPCLFEEVEGIKYLNFMNQMERRGNSSCKRKLRNFISSECLFGRYLGNLITFQSSSSFSLAKFLNDCRGGGGGGGGIEGGDEVHYECK